MCLLKFYNSVFHWLLLCIGIVVDDIGLQKSADYISLKDRNFVKLIWTPGHSETR